MRAFETLTEREILALAISNEEEDGRVYADFAESLRDDYPDTAKMFTDMAEEEDGHRRMLIDTYTERFGTHIPLIRREDVRGLVVPPADLAGAPAGLEAVRSHARQMENDAARFYTPGRGPGDGHRRAPPAGRPGRRGGRARDTAGTIEAKRLPGDVRAREDDDARRRFVLQIVQPGLVGLMDGSVSTLAPVFAAAFATHSTWNTFLVGLAASIGAGISMGFAEALADDGKLSGRGTPYLRGLVCGLMTMAGGIGHTLPYPGAGLLDRDRAVVRAVVFELAAIAWIQWRYMDTAPLSAMAKVMLGGAVVLAVGILIGNG